MIYFIQAINGGPIKIGTTICIANRLAQLRRGTGQDLRVLAATMGGFNAERVLHRQFSHLRVNGSVGREWFKADDDLTGFIARLQDDGQCVPLEEYGTVDTKMMNRDRQPRNGRASGEAQGTIVEAAEILSRALNRLGNADATTPFGGLEAHGMAILEAAEKIADAISGAGNSHMDVTSAVDRLGKSADRVAAGLHDIASAIREMRQPDDEEP